MSAAHPVHEYGFTAVPADVEKLFKQARLSDKNPPEAFPVSTTAVPDTPLARRIQEYARSHLPTPTYHHSMRVYHYGIAIKRYLFPHWEFTDETYFLTSMLHDIGTTPDNLRATRLSFEFYGGLVALDVLQHSSTGEANSASPRAQAESVAEAIIRHQDLCDIGTITAVGQLIQLATIFDNTGAHSQLVHEDTVQDVIANYPRLKWSSCFASTVQREITLKPWAHTTALGDFAAEIMGNPFNAQYE